jgi:hypothetical protein
VLAVTIRLSPGQFQRLPHHFTEGLTFHFADLGVLFGYAAVGARVNRQTLLIAGGFGLGKVAFLPEQSGELLQAIARLAVTDFAGGLGGEPFANGPEDRATLLGPQLIDDGLHQHLREVLGPAAVQSAALAGQRKDVRRPAHSALLLGTFQPAILQEAVYLLADGGGGDAEGLDELAYSYRSFPGDEVEDLSRGGVAAEQAAGMALSHLDRPLLTTYWSLNMVSCFNKVEF